MTLKSLHIMEMVENKGVKSIGFFYGRSGMKCGSPNDNRIFTVIDLFAGCGVLSLGLYQAGWEGLFAIEKNAFENMISITNNNSTVSVIKNF